jgi:nucleoside-diphosphate-sugar epimerase
VRVQGSSTELLGLRPMSVTFPDAAAAVRCCVDVSLDRLPSRCESFFIFVPHSGVFRYGKARAVLGWEPKARLEGYFTRAASL